MKLNELNMKPSLTAKKALKEHFETNLDLDKLNLSTTRQMLTKVRGLISEAKASNTMTANNSPAYMKLVFMENALKAHYGELKALPMYNTRIVVENEEVEKSQVILAAQEMVDSIQKMVEQVSDMLVKELPAVVDGVNSEVGTNEGSQFEQQATDALTQLQAALTQGKTAISQAVGVVTGQGGMAPALGGDEAMAAPGEELPGGDDMGGDMADLGGEQPDSELPDLPEEPDEEEEITSVGRAKR
jgi:hypothetical protein